MPLLIYVAYRAANEQLTPEQAFLIPVYAGLGIPILLMYFLNLCFTVWNIYRINWVLILELDDRDHLDILSFNETMSFISLYFAVSFYFLVTDLFGIPMLVYPMTYLASCLVLFFMPIKIMHSSSRMWLAKTLVRILTSGFHPSQFRDFFVTDIIASMTYSFVAIQTVFCISGYYVAGSTTILQSCSLNQVWGPSLVTALPAYFRLIQCFKRYQETQLAYPHLTNAWKYVFSLIVVLLSLGARLTNNTLIWNLWIIFSIIATLYSYGWDIFFDWGLGRSDSQHIGLRNVLVYPEWFYYTAIVGNLVLRISWVTLLAPSYWGDGLRSSSVVFVLALFEAFRRFIWAIIRMENEHSLNIGGFRAVREIPLPYKIGLNIVLTDA